VRSRKVSDLNADILEGHQSTALCHAGNISWRLGHPSSPAEIEKQLAELKAHDHALETFERTRKHLAENIVDLEKSKLTMGPLLRLESKNEKFIDNPAADALLTRDYRQPFVVPAEKDI
jgi:phage host-nuclease inhibitor protein Gam